MPLDQYEKLPSFTESLLPCLLTGSARLSQILACTTQTDDTSNQLSQCTWQASPSKVSRYSDIRAVSHNSYTNNLEMANPFDMLNSQQMEAKEIEMENMTGSICSQQSHLCEDDYFSCEGDPGSIMINNKSESPYTDILICSEAMRSGINRSNHCADLECSKMDAMTVLQCQKDDTFVCLGADDDNCRPSRDPLKEYDPLLAEKVEQELGVGKKTRTENFCSPHCSTSGASLESSGKRNAWGRLSYADLIRRAIESSPDKRLTLAQIYEWMICYVPYFRDKGDKKSSVGWKNSVRHNLSLHDQFVRIRENENSKISWWTLNASVQHAASCDSKCQRAAAGSDPASCKCSAATDTGNTSFKASSAGRKRKKKILSTLAALEGQLHMALSKKQRRRPNDEDRQARTLSDDFFDSTCVHSSDQQQGRQTASADNEHANSAALYDRTFNTCPMQQQLQQVNNTQQSESGYSISTIDRPPINCQMNYEHSNNQYPGTACGGSESYNEHAAESEYLSSSDIATGCSTVASDCNDQQLENATLLLSAACSLMNGSSVAQRLTNLDQTNIADSAQNEIGHTILSENKYDDYTPSDAVLLLQLTNGELCQVLPSGEIDFTDNDMTTHYVIQTGAANQNVSDR